jgi:hypothetical protein
MPITAYSGDAARPGPQGDQDQNHMSFILKVMHTAEVSPVPSDNEFSLYADITSVHFHRHPDGSAEAHLWVCEPVKTAVVPGFCEVEKRVSFTATAYVMNEAGKTVSTFTARRSGDSQMAA